MIFTEKQRAKLRKVVELVRNATETDVAPEVTTQSIGNTGIATFFVRSPECLVMGTITKRGRVCNCQVGGRLLQWSVASTEKAINSKEPLTPMYH